MPVQVNRFARPRRAGLLLAAPGLIDSHAHTAQQRRAGILKSIDDLHRGGITAVKDPEIGLPV